MLNFQFVETNRNGPVIRSGVSRSQFSDVDSQRCLINHEPIAVRAEADLDSIFNFSDFQRRRLATRAQEYSRSSERGDFHGSRTCGKLDRWSRLESGGTPRLLVLQLYVSAAIRIRVWLRLLRKPVYHLPEKSVYPASPPGSCRNCANAQRPTEWLAFFGVCLFRPTCLRNFKKRKRGTVYTSRSNPSLTLRVMMNLRSYFRTIP